jgi:hypothetical protein
VAEDNGSTDGGNNEPKADSNGEHSEDTSTKSATIGDVERIVSKAIEDIKGVLTDNKTDAASTRRTRTTRDGAGARAINRRATYRDTERMSAEMVEEAIKKALLDQQHEDEHKQLEKIKQEAQKAPMMPRKTTQWLLGKRFVEEKNK